MPIELVDSAYAQVSISSDMTAVDAVIRQRLHSDVVLVRQVADYIIGAGGKRMRPALVLAAARACGYEGAYHHELAAVIEFIHTRRTASELGEQLEYDAIRKIWLANVKRVIGDSKQSKRND